ncbi:hypothetical protein GVN21_04545 [Caulobacter sp. SLTY]|uniref:hypothetical protein n=1 Tax=Caulobacter sp. SLTY TaxID=2683262 RepID=UPI00141235AA|nr:hypothetical protein [Caulobacter sp. SLTY]NBB14629.1 hypothetical protein [Caulobacter sp. SLTY]
MAMLPGVTRSLTTAERDALSPGLWDALLAAGAFPRIVAAPSPLAKIAYLWRRHTPVLTLGDRIYWGRAPDDCSRQPAAMALLQHELQHVLDYAAGRLTWAGYAIDPRNWSYDLPPADRWDWSRLGAEQRAVLTEQLWRAERSRDQARIAQLRAVIPWG